MTTVDKRTIDKPGVYQITAEEYNADPVAGGSLSSTGARKLLPPSCPALYRHWVDNPKPTSDDFDFGHAAHHRLLGVGHELVLVDRPRWDTNEVKAQLAEIRARGAVPLKRPDMERVEAMVAKLRADPWVSKLFAPGTGKPEQTIVWRDNGTGVMCRARLDWLPNRAGRRFLFRDYKTGKSASPARFDRSVEDYGYHIQAAVHLAGLRALGYADQDAAALFVVQEKEEPYLVTVFELDRPAMRIGHELMRQALHIYAECTASGRWPGYAEDVVMVGVPPWVEAQYREVLT